MSVNERVKGNLFCANHSRVIVISDGLVCIIDNDTGLVASISLETLS